MKKGNNKTIEELFQELQVILQKLDAEEVSLEESFVLYQQGVTLLKTCNDKIDLVEKQILVLDQAGNMDEEE